VPVVAGRSMIDGVRVVAGHSMIWNVTLAVVSP
jgi:hypothetical protein